jgi:N-acetylneuraminic acid mutarotase
VGFAGVPLGEPFCSAGRAKSRLLHGVFEVKWMKKAIVLLAVLIVAFLVPVVSGAANPTENSWTQKAAMPTARYYFGAAVVNGTIYAIGGFGRQVEEQLQFSNVTDANEVYNPETDTWTEKTPMPTSIGGFAVAVYENKIYCFGGGIMVSDRTVAQGETLVYDPATHGWENKTSMPMPANGLEANVVDNKIYVIGRSTMVYDPATDSWATKTPMPTAVSNYASTVVDNKIYIISGSTGYPTITDLNQIYDPVTDTWSSGAPVPMGVTIAAACAVTGTEATKAIYVLGGSNSTYPLNGQYINQVYFPSNGSWSTGAPMPKDKAGLSVAVVNNMLYAIGGGHNIFTPDSTDNMQYTPFGIGAPNSTSQPTSASPSPSPSPSPTASPNSSLSSKMVTQLTQTVEPTASPTPSTFQNPTISPTQTQSLPQQTALGGGTAAAIGAVIAVAFYLRKRR